MNSRGRKLVSAALVAAAAIFIFAACLQTSESDVYGRYVAHYDAGSETVTLARDHSYVQEVRVNGVAEPFVNHGLWEWKTDRVLFHDCWAVSNGFGEMDPDFSLVRLTRCSYPAERKWWVADGIELGAPEQGLLEKQ